MNKIDYPNILNQGHIFYYLLIVVVVHENHMDHRVVLLYTYLIDMHIYSFHIHLNILEDYLHIMDDYQINIQYEDYIQ
jgi:hypothetical protein